jgi:hypothetical protein
MLDQLYLAHKIVADSPTATTRSLAGPANDISGRAWRERRSHGASNSCGGVARDFHTKGFFGHNGRRPSHGFLPQSVHVDHLPPKFLSRPPCVGKEGVTSVVS